MEAINANKEQDMTPYENMMEHIREHATALSNKMKDEIFSNAEQAAELYVSSHLGLSDDDEKKQNKKNAYIEAYQIETCKNLW